MAAVKGFGETTNDNGGKVKGFSMAIWWRHKIKVLGQLGATTVLGLDGGGNIAHDRGRHTASSVAENDVR